MACGPGPEFSSRPNPPVSFAEIQRRVGGLTEAEVEGRLGHANHRNSLADREILVWWNYACLTGEQYEPGLRDEVVNLEITFERPRDDAAAPRPAWRVASPLAITYSRHDRR